jgi:hypothetical protein
MLLTLFHGAAAVAPPGVFNCPDDLVARWYDCKDDNPVTAGWYNDMRERTYNPLTGWHPPLG